MDDEVDLREVEDLWSLSAANDKIRDQSHWRGVGRFVDDELWRRIGTTTLKHVRAFQRYLGHPSLVEQRRTVLEWGPGGGSNLVAFAPYSSRYFGVDISMPNLEECVRQADAVRFENFEPVHFNGVPQDAMMHIPFEVEIFISTAVFQHFPNRAYGRDVLSALKSRFAAGGVGFVQIRYHTGQGHPKRKQGDYWQTYRYRTVYRIDEFWQLLAEVGFEPAYVTGLTDDYAAFLFRA